MFTATIVTEDPNKGQINNAGELKDHYEINVPYNSDIKRNNDEVTLHNGQYPCTFQALPKAGSNYIFDTWVFDPATFKVKGNVTITAKFKETTSTDVTVYFDSATPN